MNAGVLTGKILPPTPVLHPIQTKISPDFGPGPKTAGDAAMFLVYRMGWQHLGWI
jgi:hypothetical protein